MPGFQFVDIIFFALIAGFLLFRLYTVLGRRTGNERRPEDLYRLPDSVTAPKDNVPARPANAGQGSAEALATGPLARALLDIKLADRAFDAAKFLSGARVAYEMIVTAFARGDREVLRPLLSDEVFASFASEIKSREAKKTRVDFHFLALQGARITGAVLKERTAEITVTFDSEFTKATYDADGKVLEGDSKAPHTVTDVWTFARDIRTANPNWILVATSSGG